MTMQYRRFGRTELPMPVLSCGGMRYQFKWQDVPLADVPGDNQRNLQATIHRALDLGINHIETARGYGSSERQLGLILPHLAREKLIVQTKIAPCENPEEFVRNFEESLQRLQLQHVDLLALHGINNQQTLEWAIRPNGCLAAARKLQQRGLCRHLGFSTHAATDVILRAVEHEADGGFDYVNLHWYYIFQRNAPAIAAATRRDMGVFIISPSDKGGMLYDPPARLAELCHPLHPMVFNDLFCLSHPEIHTLSIGAARPSDFDCHLEALPLLANARQILAPILSRLQQVFEEAVESELRDPFAPVFPAWEDAPGAINVQIILWLRNLVRAFDLQGYAKMRYNLLGNGGHWFPGQKASSINGVDSAGLCAQPALCGKIAEILRETHSLLGAEDVKRLSESK